MSAPVERPTALIIGAGASGRGHLGQLAAESSYRLAFLDRDKDLCRRLATSGRYVVDLVSARPRSVVVEGYEIHHTGDIDALYPAFLRSSVIFTAVCPENVPQAATEMAPLFARWLRETGGRPEKNVLCCENMNGSTTVFRRHLEASLPADLAGALERSVGFPDTMIARVVTRPSDPLKLLAEEYSEWTADRSAIRGGRPPVVKTLELVDHQERYLQRKLYIHNTGHAIFGYLGWLRGHHYVHEAAQDPRIMDVCERAIEESGWAVAREHAFPEDVIREYRSALTAKCVLPQLPDEIIRVVRDPLRKLGPEERFFGPIGLLSRHGREPVWLLWGVAAALIARIPGDAQCEALGREMEKGGVVGALRLAKASAPAGLVSAIRELVERLRKDFATDGRV